MLELSAATRVPMYASLALLLTGGLVNGFLGQLVGTGLDLDRSGPIRGHGGHARGVGRALLRRVRACLERRDIADTEIDRLLRSPVPVAILFVGGVGLLTILWLMIYKPS